MESQLSTAQKHQYDSASTYENIRTRIPIASADGKHNRPGREANHSHSPSAEVTN